MTVTTTADETIQHVKTTMKECADKLAELYIRDVWGYDDYAPEYKREIRAVAFDLVDLVDRL